MKEKIIPPEFQKDGFNCPICNAYAHQTWDSPNCYIGTTRQSVLVGRQKDTLYTSKCNRCKRKSLWLYNSGTEKSKLILPEKSNVPPPNEDMSDEIKEIYEEAASIVQISPRGSAALLRLCIQMLMIQLGESGKNINDDIANLVTKGLSPKVKNALDIVRVVGNNAVHPGHIIFDDKSDIALKLFTLLNRIAYDMITHPNEIDEDFKSIIPPSTKQAIAKRDKKAKQKKP